MLKSKPNLFLVGAAKAGTTSVFNYLKSHPDIFGCPIKEPNYFGSDIKWENFRRDYKKNTYLNFEEYLASDQLEQRHNAFVDEKENYEALFREAEDQKYLLDASTSYLYSDNAASEIKEYNPKAKIIIVLRKPIERTISHYKMDFVNGLHEESDIIKGIKSDFQRSKKGYGISNLYIELSLYYKQVKRYFEVFKSENILVIPFTMLKKNNSKFMKIIWEFLDLSNEESQAQRKAYNQGKMVRTPLLKKLDFVKKILPNKIITFLKMKLGNLYSKEVPLNISNNEKDFIRLLVQDDWEKTLSLLTGKKGNVYIDQHIE